MVDVYYHHDTRKKKLRQFKNIVMKICLSLIKDGEEQRQNNDCTSLFFPL